MKPFNKNKTYKFKTRNDSSFEVYGLDELAARAAESGDFSYTTFDDLFYDERYGWSSDSADGEVHHGVFDNFGSKEELKILVKILDLIKLNKTVAYYSDDEGFYAEEHTDSLLEDWAIKSFEHDHSNTLIEILE